MFFIMELDMKIFISGWLKRVARLGGLLLVLVTIPVQAEGDSTLIFGVFPYLSPRLMNEQFNPLKEYLEKTLGRPIELRSAKDYSSFIEGTGRGDYDFIFNAPQLARLAQKREGLRPLAQTGYRIQIVAVTRKDSTVKSLKDLRGHSISIGARMSLTHQIMRDELRKAGLELDHDVKYLDTAYFSNVLQSVIRGDAIAGATGSSLLDSAPAEEREQMREFFRSKEVPGFIFVGHPRLGKETLAKLQKALYTFSDTPEGKVYFDKTKLSDFRPVDEATMKSLDPYTEVYTSTQVQP
jgi:phosphonate transport system substrate-binding protein